MMRTAPTYPSTLRKIPRPSIDSYLSRGRNDEYTEEDMPAQGMRAITPDAAD